MKGGAGRIQTTVNQIANRQPSAGQVRYNQVYIGFVMDNNDSERMGRVKVWIPDFAGDKTDEATWFLASYTSPYAGATSIDDTDSSNGQTSYGTWSPPPDIGNQVVVAFVAGDPSRAVILGCLFENRMNYMIPGLPPAKTTVQDGKIEYNVSAEYNKSAPGVNTNQPIRPALKSFQDQLKKQGLDKDRVRALNTSSARRESPSKVIGTLTRSGWQMMVDEHKEENYFRIRSPMGAQIMINDKHGMIYIMTRDGNSWVEMTAEGSIHLFSEKSINMHTNEDFNIQAKRDINFEAGRNISLKTLGTTAGDGAGSGNIMIETKDSFHLKTTQDIKLQSATTIHNLANNIYITSNNSIHNKANDIQLLGSSNVATSSGGNFNITAGGTFAVDASLIHLNSGVATTASPSSAQPAQPPTIYKLNDNKTVKESISSVVPEHEPWKPHKLQGNTIVDDRGASRMIVGEQAVTPSKQPVNTEPYTFEPLSDVLKNEDYIPPDYTKCSNNKPIMEHELSDAGVRHILQSNEYSPYAKTDSNGFTIFGYDVFEPFRNIGDSLFSRYPEGITEEQAVRKSKSSLQGDVQTVKKMFGAQNPTMSQQQFDALVGLTHHVGAANISKYTDLQSTIGNGRFEDAGVIINQLEWQTPSLSGQQDSVSSLWNQCDYGSAGLPTRGGNINKNAMNNAYGLFSGLTQKQQRQVAGVSAQEGDLLILNNIYPNNVVIGQIAEDAQNNWAGFMKHEYFKQPVYNGTYLYRMIIENKPTDVINITPIDAGESIAINLVGCDDLLQYNNNFAKTMQITENFTLGDFLIGGSINGVLGVSNTEVVCNIRYLANQIFEPMIASGIVKENIVIRSAIRNGTDGGDHTKGCAVDFYLKNYGISVVDIAMWIETNLEGAYDDLVIENCEDLTSIVHISRSRLTQVGLGRKMWKPSRNSDVYLNISENNTTYGGGWDNFYEMKLNPSKAKIDMTWSKKII